LTLLTFQEVLDESQRFNKLHLLVGNRFSIAFLPGVFTYGRLKEQAEFRKISPTAKLAF
jgi:hypothetical protein